MTRRLKIASKLRFVISIALRHLEAKKKQTVLVITGVATGAMVMIITFALTKGIISDIQSKIIEISPLVTIKGEKLEGKEHLLLKSSPGGKDQFFISSRIIPDEKKEIKSFRQVISIADAIGEIDAVAPFVETRGVLRERTLTRTAIIKGIIPEREKGIASLERNVKTGSLDELNYTKNGILLGSGMAKKLKADYHDLIQLAGENGEIYILRVAGIFSSGFSATDDNLAYVNLRLAQSINGFSDNVVSGIGMHTTSLSVVNDVARRLESLTGYKAETWEEANLNLLTLFKRNNNITLFLVIFVFIVAGFGIANVLITIVLQKQKDIAIMKSMGVDRTTIKLIFLSEGMIFGISGAVLGMTAGHFLTNFIASLPVSYGESAVVRGDHIAMVETFSSYIIVALFSVIVSAFSSYIPSRRAANLKPVEILRA
ncbi:MAG: ABC transporter permease [Ignavibacteria bacterium]|jgi:lipoprotein-releasing system permease protein|nr:ABC transporter permease [Ignavibacteria bacterium]MCU7525066.1 ABC transporter permease [Ignavibacteria bacterium]